jgi:hypothetical protein
LIRRWCNQGALWNHLWIHCPTIGVLTPNVPVHPLARATLDVHSSMTVHRTAENAKYVRPKLKFSTKHTLIYFNEQPPRTTCHQPQDIIKTVQCSRRWIRCSAKCLEFG